MMKFWDEYKGLLAILVIGLLIGVAIFACLAGEIPNCNICHQPQYRLELDYYMPIIQWIGDVPTTQLIPIYKTIPHVCVMEF